MWQDHVLPRLRARGLGADRAAETLRLSGIGESILVDADRRGRAPAPQPGGRHLRPGRCGGRARERRRCRRTDRPRARGRTDRGARCRSSVSTCSRAATRAGRRPSGGGFAAAPSPSSRWAPPASSWPCSGQRRGWCSGSSSGTAPAGAFPSGAAGFAERARETAGADIGLCVRAREEADDTRSPSRMTDGEPGDGGDPNGFPAGRPGATARRQPGCAELWALARARTRARWMMRRSWSVDRVTDRAGRGWARSVAGPARRGERATPPGSPDRAFRRAPPGA